MHLLDANVLITAHNLYYPIGRFPEFWDWLVHMGEAGEIKVPVEILEEITEGSEIGRWLSEADNYGVFCGWMKMSIRPRCRLLSRNTLPI